MSDEVVLIDGNSLLYRAFFALPLLSSDQGVHTNAVFGFTTILLKILEEKDPNHILVAFDAGKTTFRHKTYGEYKGGRQKTPPELSEQFPVVRELLEAFGIKHYELELYEADDIIGTLANEATDKNQHTTIYTGDKDLLQLVSDSVAVSLTRKGISEIDHYTPESIEEKIGVTHQQIIDMKALMGDTSDNIPGVPGVGEKTAVKLIKQYGTLENIYENIDEISGKKLKENLINHKEDAFMSQELVTINTASPIEINMKDLKYEGYDTQKVIEFFKAYGFKSLIDRLEGESEAPSETMEAIEFEVVQSIDEKMLAPKQHYFVTELWDENYHLSDIVGFSLKNETGQYFIPTDIALSSDEFKAWLEDDSKDKIVSDAKALKVAMAWRGMKVKGVIFDVFLAAYIVNPQNNAHDLPGIARFYNLNDLSYNEEIYGKGAKRKLPEDAILSEHVVRKAVALENLHEILDGKLAENDQRDLYYQLEMPLSHILSEMEYNGVSIDRDKLKEMKEDLSERLEAIEQRIHGHAGEAFNINSPKQLGVVLFEKLGLPVIKKTKTGYSTAVDVLEKLQGQHEIIDDILLYRQLAKLQSTYIEGLLKVIHKQTEKVHTRFNQVLTQTGRLSSVDPNLQNIPIRLEEGRRIRQAFIPSSEDRVIFAADYSQIELRVLAHISNDEKLIQAFINDKDIHTQTAKEVFGVAEDEVTSLMRRHAKAVNFGIVYGISDYGLSQSLGITRKEAGEFIQTYFESYPDVKRYLDDIVNEAKRTGYVDTIMNRRRYLPEINSRNFNLRSFAERTAMNSPIQGSAADIIKQAMVDVEKALKDSAIDYTLLLQVHDELIFEVARDDVEALEKAVKEAMENTVSLRVPLKVDASYGDTWYDAK